ILLVMGAATVAGGFYYRKERFNRTAASMGATLLALACAGLIMPALFHHLLQARADPRSDQLHRIESLSEEIAAVLALIYVLSLVFPLVTHRDLLSGEDSGPAAAHGQPEWHWGTGLALLLAATAGVSWMSHLLVGTVEQARTAFGMN